MCNIINYVNQIKYSRKKTEWIEYILPDKKSRTVNEKERKCLPKDLSEINLLLVNDNGLLLYAQEKFLSKQGFRVYTALDGDVGLKTFEYAPVGYFDIILTDIWMERTDGDKMAKNIRTLDRPDAEKVIIIADDGPYLGTEVTSYRESGIDGFLEEMMSVEALGRVLQKYQFVP